MTDPVFALEPDVPRNVRLAEAPSHGMPAMKLEAQSKGALAYLALAEAGKRWFHARWGGTSQRVAH